MVTLAVYCCRCDTRMAADGPDSRGVVTYRCPCGAYAELRPDGGLLDTLEARVVLETPDGLAPVRVPSSN